MSRKDINYVEQMYFKCNGKLKLWEELKTKVSTYVSFKVQKQIQKHFF